MLRQEQSGAVGDFRCDLVRGAESRRARCQPGPRRTLGAVIAERYKLPRWAAPLACIAALVGLYYAFQRINDLIAPALGSCIAAVPVRSTRRLHGSKSVGVSRRRSGGLAPSRLAAEDVGMHGHLLSGAERPDH